MALSQTFTPSQSQAATILYLDDLTGSYNVTTNPGGYGAPNTERTDLALILIAKYKAIAADDYLTISSYDPEIVTEWTMPSITRDGHYEFKVYSVPKSGTEGSPVSGMFRWDFATDLLERYNGSTWVTSSATDGVYLELETYDFDHVTVDYPVLGLMMIALNNANKLGITGCKSQSRSDIEKIIMDTTNMLNGSLALFAEGSYSQAQENIEKYQSRVDQITALT